MILEKSQQASACWNTGRVRLCREHRATSMPSRPYGGRRIALQKQLKNGQCMIGVDEDTRHCGSPKVDGKALARGQVQCLQDQKVLQKWRGCAMN